MPKIMGYLKYPGAGRTGSCAPATDPFCWPSNWAGPGAGRQHSELPPWPGTRRGHSCAQGLGWFKEKAKKQEPRALVYGWASGRKGQRGRKATAWKGREPHGRFSEGKKGCNLFFLKYRT